MAVGGGLGDERGLAELELRMAEEAGAVGEVETEGGGGAGCLRLVGGCALWGLPRRLMLGRGMGERGACSNERSSGGVFVRRGPLVSDACRSSRAREGGGGMVWLRCGGVYDADMSCCMMSFTVAFTLLHNCFMRSTVLLVCCLCLCRFGTLVGATPVG